MIASCKKMISAELRRWVRQHSDDESLSVMSQGRYNSVYAVGDALVLKLAREYGASIDLAVRAQDDHQQFATQEVTLDYILARFAITLPGKQPYSIENARGLDLVSPP